MRIHDDNASFRFNQVGLKKFLGDLECEIMELAWKLAKPVVTVREVYDALRKKREIAYTTVMTTMVRLSEKELLKIVDKVGLANCYTPAQTRDEFISSSVDHVLEIFFKEFPDECKDFVASYETRKTRRGGRKR
ncbi:MAG: BlaI/MecI/CopY family transcriptional regulator [Candidatus Melainabacteria bacterium]|nr:BlaI/MecI/CopY family transcriptional regulator [Candidatus Melainabacteria bacterium]